MMDAGKYGPAIELLVAARKQGEDTFEITGHFGGLSITIRDKLEIGLVPTHNVTRSCNGVVFQQTQHYSDSYMVANSRRRCLSFVPSK